jgi:hypothetical protein
MKTILFWKLECGKYSREETIVFLLFRSGNYMRKLECWSQLDFHLVAPAEMDSARDPTRVGYIKE